MPIIRSISGLRATIDDGDLNRELIFSYCKAFAEFCNFGKIVVGRDGRLGSDEVEQMVIDALLQSGSDVVRLGVVPTPTVQLIAELSENAGGIAITASHNPQNWNGLKFINSDGVFLDENENSKLWQIIDNKSFRSNDKIGKLIDSCDAIEYHLNKILSIPIIFQKIENIKKRKFKVAVDAVNASGSKPLPKLLKKFGCEVLELYCDGSGIFPHEPEPLPKNLTDLANYVKYNNCDLGVAVDPDADRLVLVDENGTCVNEELTIALAIDTVLRNCSTDKVNVVVNLSTSNVSKMICDIFGATLTRSAVGEINVVKKMKEVSAVIGGEGSGGVILPQCHYGRDSLVGTALVLTLLTDLKKNLSEIISEFPKLYMKKEKQLYDGDFSALKNKIKSQFLNAKVDESDGIRLDFVDNSWLQIRKSNTEPIIRIIAESSNEKITNELIQKVKQIVEIEIKDV